MKTQQSVQATNPTSNQIRYCWFVVISNFNPKDANFSQIVNLLSQISPLENDCPKALTGSILNVIQSILSSQNLLSSIQSLHDHQERRKYQKPELISNTDLSHHLAHLAPTTYKDECLEFLYTMDEISAIGTILNFNSASFNRTGLFNYICWRAGNEINLSVNLSQAGRKTKKKSGFNYFKLFACLILLSFLIGFLGFYLLTKI